jgi:YD repeat-containing protein
MKKLSETYKELGIAFSFPIKIKDANGKQTYYEESNGFWRKYEYNADGNETYYENSTGYWHKYEYNADGNETCCENSTGYWHKSEYDADGNETYYETSTGYKRGTPKSARTCEGKVVEVDGIKYKLKAL